MSALSLLTPTQAAAVHATAAAHLRDPEELAAELLPLLTGQPRPQVALPPVPVRRDTVEMEAIPPRPDGWSVLGTTPEGFQVLARPVSDAESAVNDPLTLGVAP